ncbi:hypothetical protein [Halorubrum halophilum]|uniref:hypothetical protein n=1 Tax=Halorubrum halophilum TaxID=413816 RepID=UPI00186ACC50|nr:hypothetical protein [Halorubrum halophilum]
MNQPKYIAGLSSLGTGAAVPKTAATTMFSVNDWTANINIVSDSPAGAIGFKTQNTALEVINGSGDGGAIGEVVIDITAVTP